MTRTRRSPATAALASLVSERTWQRQLVELAEILGWRWVHFRPAQHANGRWMTPVSGPLGVGWPDLVLVRDRVVMVECKAEGAYASPPQRAVHEALRAAGVEVHVWRPSDLALATEVLR